MGCRFSREIIDFDTILPLGLRIQGGLAKYSGTTQQGRYQARHQTEPNYYSFICYRH